MSTLRLSVLTVSDSRDLDSDKSGAWLARALQDEGHALAARQIVPDDKYMIRAQLSAWIADPEVDGVLITGGTGITGRDVTPEAVEPLLDKTLGGFGELFRQLSFADIGASTIQSRALGGVANGTLVFCLPGSSGAVRLAWEQILQPQLDIRTTPCNFAMLLPRLKEHA
ncbi:molybdopterin biosynthesis protein B [Oceanococcus atlanticus]|uniref:Molybdenum cofactor biosynthesis protein B n=1 Tax=Oceanococcus atlanticus TaxID=1317117 RepID=A0A1Y1SIQ9_9GAMM|nr:molybdenum cofactor biosynthesis protein B [Oceanococcus atlanticus]ORE89537.1 molybdopterin biosynthesis protein B [Oceanococcus atlanticus]